MNYLQRIQNDDTFTRLEKTKSNLGTLDSLDNPRLFEIEFKGKNY